ncbi:MAG: chromosomal replication initiator protein DnaA [Propionibacteriaceae bacterium]
MSRVEQTDQTASEVTSATSSSPQAEPDLSTIWQHVVESFDPSSRAFVAKSIPLGVHGSLVIVGVADAFTGERLDTRLRAQLEESLTVQFGHPMRIHVTVEPELHIEPMVLPASVEPAVPSAEMLMTEPDNRAPIERNRSGIMRLNPKYTFDSFVIGSSNRFAHAAAIAVAEQPGKAYNPLLIYGDSGLGKTHLLHALGHYVHQYVERARVKYVSTEELTNDFINSISDNKTSEFRSRYREVDVLLVDDIQFLESKIQTQEEFFHTFNTLHNAQKQIVMTSDRPPKLLEALEPRLRSRFEWGLITDIQPPDLETRIAILRKKASAERLTVGPDVLEFIASKVTRNIRELEGALIRVAAFASLNRTEVDMGLAEIVLRDLIPDGAETEINVSQIMSQTAAYYGITVDDLCSKNRTQVLVSARQIAMYLSRELTDLSLPKIGQAFGGRDHTTVIHSVNKVSQLMTEQRTVYNQVTELTNRIKQQASQR